MRGIRIVELVAHSLRENTLPSLRRPPVGPAEPPTEQLARWGVAYYVYSVIAHMQRILTGLAQLSSTGNIPASFVISRHVFEWAAHACYMSRNLTNYFKRMEWDRAWSLLTIAVTGNLWARQHGQKYVAPRTTLPNAPDPLGIPNIITAYENYQSQTRGAKDIKDAYGLLSEHSHPNSACLQLYHRYEADGLRFGDPEPLTPLPFANWCLIDWLVFLDNLLKLANETTVRPDIVALLRELARRAPTIRS
jgi:hypothetical protein